jgi:hypothetical protein
VQAVTADGLLFPHTTRVLRIQRRRRLHGAKKWSSETVHTITDLPAEQASAAETASWTRGHRTVKTPPTGCEMSSPEKTNPRSGPVTRLPCPPPSAT